MIVDTRIKSADIHTKWIVYINTGFISVNNEKKCKLISVNNEKNVNFLSINQIMHKINKRGVCSHNSNHSTYEKFYMDF